MKIYKNKILLFLSIVSLSTLVFSIPPYRPLKFLFVIHEFPKFIQPFILNQITGIIDRGHQVYIYANHGHRGIVPAQVEKYRLLERTFYGKLPPHIKDIDIILCQFGIDGYCGLQLKEKYGLQGKLVTCFRGNDLGEVLHSNSNGEKYRYRGPFKVPCYYLNMYDELFKSGDLFLPVCNAFKQKLLELGCKQEKIVVLHSAIDCKKFIFKARYPIKNEAIRIMSTSRLVEKKGIEYAIKAIAHLRKEYPHIEFTIIGGGYLESSLKRLVRSLRAEKQIKFAGWRSQEEVIKLLNQAHIFVLPSITAKNDDQEGIPNSIKEAMAMGLPVISTYHSGIPELVKDGISGLLVPERNAKILAERIKYLIYHPELWSFMGRAGRQFVERQFNMELENDKLIKLCYELIR